METTSSGSKAKMEGSGKWLVTALDINTKKRSMKYKMARYDIGNVSMKDLVFITFVHVLLVITDLIIHFRRHSTR